MHLLYSPRSEGHPVEYLLSRIRGRRARLIRSWSPLIFDMPPQDYLSSPSYQGFVRERTIEGVWRDLLREYRWVYDQMDGRLREIFRPFFAYAELRTMFMGLRYLEGGKKEMLEDTLDASMLSMEFKAAFRTSEDAAAAVAKVGRRLAELSGDFKGLSDAFKAGGLRSVEQMLTNTYLASVLRTSLHPVMRMFFRRVIDSRNILGLYNSLRLKKKDPSVFIAGGSVSVERLRDLLRKEENNAVNALIKRVAGAAATALDVTGVETALYRGTTRHLRKEGKDPLGVGLILDYLWRCSIEITNLSVLLSGKDLEREAVAAELVQ